MNEKLFILKEFRFVIDEDFFLVLGKKECKERDMLKLRLFKKDKKKDKHIFTSIIEMNNNIDTYLNNLFQAYPFFLPEKKAIQTKKKIITSIES